MKLHVSAIIGHHQISTIFKQSLYRVLHNLWVLLQEVIS